MTTEIYNNASLAQAAYSNLSVGSTNTLSNLLSLKDPDNGAGMTQTQAEAFAARYPTVVTQYTDSISGFSATVFMSSTGQITLAIRGTDELTGTDGDDDIGIAVNGIAHDQIITMNAWWSTVSTEGKLALALANDAVIDVTGHSLGGHLAMAFGSLFASQTGDISVFNAPGFIDNVENNAFFDLLVSGTMVPTGVNTINVIANEAYTGASPWNAVAGKHTRPGTPINITIEDQTNLAEPDYATAFNHSQMILTDSLAVYNLLTQLDNSISPTHFNALFQTASNEEHKSLERIIDSISKLFGVSSTPLPTGNAQREALYQAINSIENNLTGTNYQLSLVNSSIVTQAMSGDKAALYALINLQPFVIKGENQAETDALYNPHNTSDELNAENYSEQYLTDRAEMLQWFLKYNQGDIEYSEYLSADGFDGNVTYTELSSETNNGQDLVLKIDGDGLAIPYEQIKFGTEYDDGIAGADNDDRLYGGAGNDAILGKDGDDYIEGGKGNDTMTGGDGDDVFIIQDSGDTVIELDGEGDDIILSHVDFTLSDDNYVEILVAVDEENLQQETTDNVDLTGNNTDNIILGNSQDNKLVGNDGDDFIDGGKGNDIMEGGDGDDTLVIQDTGDTVIELDGEGDDTIFTHVDFSLSDDNFVETLVAVPEDSLQQETTDNVDLTGNISDNKLYGNSQNNTLIGGEGRDFFLAGAGDDKLYAQNDSDHSETVENALNGNQGDDELYGADGTDYLWGQEDNDTLTGYLGDDYLKGGTGNDTYIWNSGDGNDYIGGHEDTASDNIQINGANISGITIEWDEAQGRNVITNDGGTGITDYRHNSGFLRFKMDDASILRIYGWENNDYGIDIPTTPSTPTPVPVPPVPTPVPRDPLAFDLNGDGIVSTLSLAGGVHFDVDNNGFAERTAWIGADDGLLALDRDNNGLIESGAELFGTETLLSNGDLAKNGFEALKEFDDNNDGVIDANDAVFTDLKMWIDADSDGISDESELVSLADLEIQSINLNYIQNVFNDANGVQHREESSAETITDDVLVNTLWFQAEYQNTVPVETLRAGGIEIPDTIAELPDVKAFGNLYSLHQAMALDASGDLQALVELFTQEIDPATRKELVDEILIVWSGQQATDPDSRGYYIDGQELGVIETFLGQPALQDNPDKFYGASLNRLYDGFKRSVYAQMLIDSHASDLFSQIEINNEGGETVFKLDDLVDYTSLLFDIADVTQSGLDLDKAKRTLVDAYDLVQGLDPYDQSQTLINDFKQAMLSAANDYVFEANQLVGEVLFAGNDVITTADADDLLNSSTGDDHVNTLEGDDTVYAGAGNDTVFGGSDDDTLYGEEGDDKLNGGEGNDSLFGGEGDDLLTGGAGDDTIYIVKGEGSDDLELDLAVALATGVDTIVFSDDILSTETTLLRSDNDLLLVI